MSEETLHITVLICTQSRRPADPTIASLNAAARPTGQRYVSSSSPMRAPTARRFPADYASGRKPAAGLDRRADTRQIACVGPGIAHADGPIVAFVDDDHRVDQAYRPRLPMRPSLADAGLICGRILPDWDGTEPAWVLTMALSHLSAPVPRYDQVPRNEDRPRRIPSGNLVARLDVTRLQALLTELGPAGHDLGGAEDLEWVRRAMRQGALPLRACHRSIPYVDGALDLAHLMRKGFSGPSP